MIPYSIKDESILIIGGREKDFRYPINTVFDYNDRLIILIGLVQDEDGGVSMSNQPNNNICAINSNCEIIWNI